MKVGIVLYQNMMYAPFLSFYENILLENNIEYEIIYLKRPDCNGEEIKQNCFAIKWVGKSSNSLINKLLSAIKFKVVSKKIISKRKFNFLIILTTTPGVLLANYLKKHFKKKYIIDIRDYTKEHIKLYFKEEKKLVDNAAINVISSPDFRLFLPVSKYHLCHNFNFLCSELPAYNNQKKTIVILYIGTIQYLEQCNKLIDLVIKDDRFSFHFFGNEVLNNSISNIINDLKNERIVFHGPFLPSEKASIYESSDLIFNCYGNNNMVVKYAISNKLYDGASFFKPLIVSPNTTMEKISNNYAYAIDFDTDTDLNGLFEWYNHLDWEAYRKYCRKLLTDALHHNEELKEKIINEIK